MPSYIGIDYGLRNIGIAIGQSITATASALTTLTLHKGKKFTWDEFDKIMKQWQPQAIIIGLPLTEEGNEQLISKQSRNFAKKLKQRYSIEVHEVDERYSSMQAQEDFAHARHQGHAKRKHSHNLDAHAAKNILQRWLDTQL